MMKSDLIRQSENKDKLIDAKYSELEQLYQILEVANTKLEKLEFEKDQAIEYDIQQIMMIL